MMALEQIHASAPGALDEFAREAAGACVERVAILTEAGELVRLENVHPKPERNFRVRDADWIEALDMSAAVFHSHPTDAPESWCPSESDQRSQIAHRRPWVIVPPDGAAFVFGAPDDPGRALVGRGFRHGVDDCFALVRDAWSRYTGRTVPNFARGWKWWRRGEPIIENGLARLGFVPVPGVTPRRGDVVALKIRGAVFHHLAFMDSPAVMLHHPSPGRPYDPTVLSRSEPAERWLAHPHQVYREPGP